MQTPKKLFNQKAITIATYFGGPLAAGYLVKKNYEAYDQYEKGKNAFIIGIVSTVLIFAGIYSIPDHIIDKIPNAVIPAIYTAIIYLIVEKIQGQRIKEHKESGGEFHSAWKATGIGAIFMVVLIAVLVGSAYISGDFSKPGFDAATYDSEVARFTQNESKSLAVYDVIDSAEPQYLIQEFKKAIALWEENREIVKKLNGIENLPSALLEQNKLLLKYCDLRIQLNNIIVQAISEDTDKYDTEIDRIVMEINKVIEKLEGFKK